VNNDILEEWLTCPCCEASTHGHVDKKYILKLFGYQTFGVVEGTIIFKCHKCEFRWTVKVSK
jgi:hypothetical protein